MDNVDRCVSCGAIIPEGVQVCLDCYNKPKSCFGCYEDDKIAWHCKGCLFVHACKAEQGRKVAYGKA